MFLKKTTESRRNGYYLNNEIWIYTTDFNNEVTLAHEFGHHIEYEKNLFLNEIEAEKSADLIAVKLLGLDKVVEFYTINNLNRHNNDKHLTAQKRISFLKNQ